MKKINNRYYDDRGNSWSAIIETEESALAKSKTLTNCFNCSDCSYCSRCSDCSDCSYCYNCSRCSNCFNCSDCSRCSDFKSQPQTYTTGRIGSRNSQTRFYWNAERQQVVCGCWKGTIEEFKARVEKVYQPDNAYYLQYTKEIEIMKMLVN